MSAQPDSLDAAVIVALGANLPGAYPSVETLLDAAVARLTQEGLVVTRRSGWWRSAAWPDPSAPAFLNGVVVVDTDLEPIETMARLHDIESMFGRQPGARNAPRTLDLDLIAHGRRIVDTDSLVAPHPRADQRLFVMGPLAQIAPDWRHPALGLTARELARSATVGRDAAPI